MTAVKQVTNGSVAIQPVKQPSAAETLAKKTQQAANEATTIKSGGTIFRTTYGTSKLFTPKSAKVPSLAQIGGLGALLLSALDEPDSPAAVYKNYDSDEDK